MNYNTLLLTQANGVAVVTLNRPEKRNAISYELIDELLSVLDDIEESSSGVLIITGAGKSFCAGMDLDNLKSLTSRTPDQNLKDSEMMARLFRAIYEFPKPTIAAVNGPAIAGGCGIATLCDLTIASMEAKFGYTEVRIGFIPAIVSAFLVRQIGEKRARDLLLTGRIIDAAEALQLGLVNEVHDPTHLMDRAFEVANSLCENSPASLATTKSLLSQFSLDDLSRDINSAVKANARIRTTADFSEGVSSFLEKRKPKWTGK